MTRLHRASALQVLGAPSRQVRITTALTLQARQHGWLSVASGQVWITRSGDGTDHVLGAGQVVALAPGQQWVAEPWQTGGEAQLRWVAGAPAPVPAAQVPGLRTLPSAAARPAAAGLAWRALAWGLRGVAARLAAAARRAESRASRAQGRICAADSMAASGALQ